MMKVRKKKTVKKMMIIKQKRHQNKMKIKKSELKVKKKKFQSAEEALPVYLKYLNKTLFECIQYLC